MSETLKPCPFCGSKDLTVSQRGTESNKVRVSGVLCEKCGASITTRVLREPDAITGAWSSEWLKKEIIKRWNTRDGEQK